MAYVWFNLVLEALGKKLNYESISNLYGNSFAKDSAKIIQGCNPLLKTGSSKGSPDGIMSLAGQIKIVEAKSKEEKTALASNMLGDISWANGLFDGDDKNGNS